MNSKLPKSVLLKLFHMHLRSLDALDKAMNYYLGFQVLIPSVSHISHRLFREDHASKTVTLLKAKFSLRLALPHR